MTGHSDVAETTYGWAPDPVFESPWWRAYDASERASRRREHEARSFADFTLEVRNDASERVAEIRRQEYAKAVAAQMYADAVYSVERDLKWPNGVPA